MNSLLLDANVIIRFLTKDDDIQSPIAYQIFEKAINGALHLILSPMIIAECTWVLQMKRYGYSRNEIAERLSQIILSPGIKTFEREIILKALSDYSTHNVDFIDAYLGSMSVSEKDKDIITWNVKDFKRLGCSFYTPEQLL